MHEMDMIPVGDHITIQLEQFVPYHLERPYPNAWHAMIQTNQELWFRCDGAMPAKGAGFMIDASSGITVLPVCNDDFVMVSHMPICRVQVRWLGINGSLTER